MMYNRNNKILFIFIMLVECLWLPALAAQPSVAVLDFELRDLTVIPGIPQEVARTASVKTLLEEELRKADYKIVSIPLAEQTAATAGFGYLFDHNDVAAQLAKKYKADYVLVGRLHKPSYLFVYLMAHLIDVNKELLIADYISEIKGSDKKLTKKGVESLVDKINSTFVEKLTNNK